MAQTITCPRCGAHLKANKAPAPDQTLRCLKCRHAFRVGETAIASGPPAETRPAAAWSPSAGPKLSRPWIALAVCAVAAIAASAYILGRTGRTPPVSDAKGPLSGEPVAVAPKTPDAKPEPKPVAPKADPKPEPKAEPKVDAEAEARQAVFTRLMIDAGVAAQLKNWDEAVTNYLEASKLAPDDATLKEKLVDAQKQRDAADVAKAAEAKLQREVDALVGQGKEALGRNQVAAASEFFKLALQKSATSVEAAQLLTEAQERLQQADVKQRKLADFDARILSGKAALQAGKGMEALRDFLAAGKLLPDDPLPAELAKEAEKLLAVEKDQGDRKKELELVLGFGREQLKAKKFDDAIDTFKQALKIAPNDAGAKKGLADAEAGQKTSKAGVQRIVDDALADLRAGRVNEAINRYRDGLRQHPDDETLSRGLRYAEQIEANRQTYYAALNRGIAALSFHRYADALLAFNEALRIVPNDTLAYSGLLDAQRGIARQEQLRIEYERLVNQGLNAIRVRRYVEGAQFFTAALKLVRPANLPDPQVLRMQRYAEAMARGTAAANARNWNEAIAMFQAALAANPGDFAAQTALQQAINARGRPKG